MDVEKLRELLIYSKQYKVFFMTHDPTQENMHGPCCIMKNHLNEFMHKSVYMPHLYGSAYVPRTRDGCWTLELNLMRHCFKSKWFRFCSGSVHTSCQ